MATLNELSSRITHLVNQPHNHALKERMKDVIKSMFANRIRQSIEKHGIDNNLKLTFVVQLKELKSANPIFEPSKIITLGTIENAYYTKNQIPVPLRIMNDAPFTYVGDKYGHPYKYESSLAAFELNRNIRNKNRQSGRLPFLPIGGDRVYTLSNNYIIVGDPLTDTNIETFNTEETDIDTQAVDDSLILYVTGIFENPDEVLNLYNTEDGQDLELPLPSDMIEEIIATILKVEFNLMPKDDDIKFVANSPVITNKTK